MTCPLFSSGAQPLYRGAGKPSGSLIPSSSEIDIDPTRDLHSRSRFILNGSSGVQNREMVLNARAKFRDCAKNWEVSLAENFEKKISNGSQKSWAE